MHTGTSLLDAAKDWATPAASLINYEEDPASFQNRSARLKAEGTRPLGANLGQEAKMWQTPTTAVVMGGNATRGGERGSELLLKGQAKMLSRDAAQWQTPRASDPEKAGPNQSSKGRPALAAQAQWPTAAATDFKGSSKEGQRRGQLGEAILKHGRLVQATSKGGDESSPRTPASLRLNPAFVEWLMGWPAGWSLPVVGCAGSRSSSTRSGPID